MFKARSGEAVHERMWSSRIQPRSSLILLVASLGLLSCGGGVTITSGSFCDGIHQPTEPELDSPYDVDGDGFFDATNDWCIQTYPPEQLDCDDFNPAVHPAATEVTCNDVDEDCNPDTPDTLDVDGDGSTDCEDCDDEDATRSPAFEEIACNDIDDDCDPSSIDMIDADGDGVANCTDCDDDPATGASVNPGETETTCNGIDDDCDPLTLDDELEDHDLDGATVCGADHIRGNADDDCDDQDPNRFPGNPEICDGFDNDCDWSLPADEEDGDDDSFRTCTGDCDDTDGSRYPGSTACNPGNDSDCDGTNDENDPDAIGSGC